MSPTVKRLIPIWTTDIYERALLIDIDNKLDWYSLAIGFALAHQCTPDEAYEFALHMRYVMMQA